MSAMKEFLSSSYLFGSNAPFVEELYESWLGDPQSVPQQWREYFDRLQAVPPAGGGHDDLETARYRKPHPGEQHQDQPGQARPAAQARRRI